MSVGLLIIAHRPFGGDLVKVATRILGAPPQGLEALEVVNDVPCEVLLEDADRRLQRLDRGDGVLVMTDLYGSTPANVAVALLARHDRVKVIAGLNLPMLLRALTYASLDLESVAAKALQGGRDGVLVCPGRDEA